MAFGEDRTKGPKWRAPQAPRGTGTAVTMMLSW